ncbi:hypothetical protein [Deinococcus geothermalis]|nr:hypothetical protein [Deinococcus geothermalis]
MPPALNRFGPLAATWTLAAAQDLWEAAKIFEVPAAGDSFLVLPVAEDSP